MDQRRMLKSGDVIAFNEPMNQIFTFVQDQDVSYEKSSPGHKMLSSSYNSLTMHSGSFEM